MLSIKRHTPEDFSENKYAHTETLPHELCTLVLGHIQIFENERKENVSSKQNNGICLPYGRLQGTLSFSGS